MNTGETAGVAGPKTKRKYDSEDTKRRLLQAALDVFSKAGFDGATTRMIAKKAKVNDSLIHRYFESKHGLFFALFRRFHENFVGELPYEACATLEEELRSFLRFRMDISHREKKFLKLGITQAILDPKVSAEVSQLHRNFPSSLRKRLTELQEAGKIRPEIPIEQFTIIVSGIGFAMSMFRDVCFKYESEQVEKVLDLFSQIVARGAGTAK